MQRSTLTLALAATAAVLASGALALSAASYGQSRQVAATLATAPGYVEPAAVKAALLADPRMLVEAGQRLQAINESDRREASRSMTDAAAAELAAPTRGFLGNPSGKRVVVEFFDYQCEHCRTAMPALARAVAQDPELKIVLRDIPILGPGSEIAARVALAAARQDRYMAVHEALMLLPLPIVPETAVQVAVNAGADRERIEADMMSEAVTEELRASVSLANRIGVTATPGFAAPGAGVLLGFGSQERFREFAASVRAD